MVDFPNKVITVILLFLMLVVAPITWSYVRADMVAERLILNEVVAFIDKVTDKGTVTQQDLDELYIAINASGGTYDVRVNRYIRIATKDLNADDPNKAVRTIYVNADISETDPVTGESVPVEMNSGDMVKVSVKEIGSSPTKNLLWNLLKLDKTNTDFSLAGTVR